MTSIGSGGRQLPTPRIGTPPVDQRDYDDRHEIRVTSDDETLNRYLRLSWHRVGQRLVLWGGLTALAFAFLALLRLTGMPIETAARIAIAGLASSGGGYGIYSVGQAARRRRRRNT